MEVRMQAERQAERAALEATRQELSEQLASAAAAHEAAMAAARPKETEVTQFRVRPWPVPVGCEADLRAKREAALRSIRR